ncbi:MAG TPA: FadR/GntR family transcriptional regulator [Stellaceae bacterium]|nr:FadR/GntR family transcriptional regulator [Stellaceae bacterium]
MDQSDSLTDESGGGSLLPPLVRVTRRSAADDVRAQLVSLIESGKLKVDHRLPPEHELAKQFGVSRPVVREALVGLNALGLTTSHAGKGTFVTANHVRVPLLLGRYSPAHLNEVRRYLEVPAARLAAERRTDSDVGQLAAILARMEDTDDPAKRNKLDADFHIAIAQAGGNPLTVKLIEDLRSILEAHSLAAAAMPNRRTGALAEHRAIYEAILRRDPTGAATAMSAHLNAVDNSFIKLAGSAPAKRR